MVSTHEFEPGTLATGSTVVGSCEFGLEAVEQMADHLRSWAVIRGATITGTAFLRLWPDGRCEVHLPVEPGTAPHPQTGLRLEHTRAEEVAVTPGVQFEEMRELFDSLRAERAEASRSAFVELRPSEHAFKSGMFVIPWNAAASATPPTVRSDEPTTGVREGDASGLPQGASAPIGIGARA